MITPQLLQRCHDGEPFAVEELFHNFYGRVFRLALSVLDDGYRADCVEEAEDAAQEVFLIVLRALPDFNQKSSFSTWLYAITVNTCRSRLRKRSALRRLKKALQVVLPLPFASANAPFSPEEGAVRNEKSFIIWRAVQALDEKHRLPLVLHYYHDFPVAEIAQLLGLPIGTVLSRLYSARDRLRRTLARVQEEEVSPC